MEGCYNKMIIRARAPVRISFAGGGTDVSPYCEEKGGCVVNAAINKYAYATLTTTKDKVIVESSDFNQTQEFRNITDIYYNGQLDLLKAVIKHYGKENIKLFLRSDTPPRSGLGSSASAFVAAMGVFEHLKNENSMTNYEIAELAYKLEREELKNYGGRQDQYAAVFGGINFMEFKGNDFVKISPLKLSKDVLLELEKNLVLVNIGERRDSGDILIDQTARYEKGKEKVINAMDRSKELAIEVKKALIKGDLNRFGNLLHEAWEEKKKYSKMISNLKIDYLYKIARNAGAIGGKVSGAGGGGHMIFYCKPNTEQLVSKTLEAAGCRVVSFSFDTNGLQSWEIRK